MVYRSASVAGVLLAILAGVYLRSQSSHDEYRSVISQSINYFSRTGAGGVPLAPIMIGHPAAWRGEELRRSPHLWIKNFTGEDLRDLKAATTAAIETLRAGNRSLGTLQKRDFPLSVRLRANVSSWRREVHTQSGRGFVIIRGIRVAEWADEELETLFWALGKYLGIPRAQDSDGKLLGHVRDIGEDASRVRQYKTNAHIKAHCDSADVVGLLCVSQGESGGHSRLVSSVSVFNELVQRYPREYVSRLFRPFPLDVRGSGGISWIPISPLRYGLDGRLRSFYHTEYFRSVYWEHVRDKPADKIPREDEKVLDAYDSVVNDPALYLDMKFEEGDIQLVSNHFVLHARTAFTDSQEHKRHLLRLWLSLESETEEEEKEGSKGVGGDTDTTTTRLHSIIASQSDWISRRADTLALVAGLAVAKFRSSSVGKALASMFR
eukprot:jgi/Bigna1/89377/estExt_fgenesh1_pg.C_480071